MGWHETAPWERRLIRADDGTTWGQTGASNAVMGLDYIDASGTHWPFTRATSTSSAWVSPAGIVGTLKTAVSGDACYSTYAYQLAFHGGSTLCFDSDGRLDKEIMKNGLSVTYVRDSANGYRVTTIETDNPGGGGTQMTLSVLWGTHTVGSVTYGYTGSGPIDRIYAIQDMLGRQVRFTYTNTGSGDPYLASVQRFADSTSTTALAETDYAWSASPGNCSGCQVITAVDRWIYSSDPGPGGSGAAQAPLGDHLQRRQRSRSRRRDRHRVTHSRLVLRVDPLGGYHDNYVHVRTTDHRWQCRCDDGRIR